MAYPTDSSHERTILSRSNRTDWVGIILGPPLVKRGSLSILVGEYLGGWCSERETGTYSGINSLTLREKSFTLGIVEHSLVGVLDLILSHKLVSEKELTFLERVEVFFSSPSSEELLTLRSSDTRSHSIMGISRSVKESILLMGSIGIVLVLHITGFLGGEDFLVWWSVSEVLDRLMRVTVSAGYLIMAASFLAGKGSICFLVAWDEECSILIFFLTVGSGRSSLEIKLADLFV